HKYTIRREIETEWDYALLPCVGDRGVSILEAVRWERSTFDAYAKMKNEFFCRNNVLFDIKCYICTVFFMVLDFKVN
ncbi:hypothetical protein, partial [Porphyromonas loveana]|uniref:hypothetical protein n=1 Tax=Porphyromonas loveana TaxID=1884669 RepID=UPI00359F9477